MQRSSSNGYLNGEAAAELSLQEYWTDSRLALVVSGRPERLLTLADELDMLPENIIQVTATRAVLALSGDPLLRYQQRYGDHSSG